MSTPTPQKSPQGSTRLAVTLLAATVPLFAAWALTAGSSGIASKAAAATTGPAEKVSVLSTSQEAAAMLARTAPGYTPREAKAKTRRLTKAAEQRGLLSHPLVGEKLGVVIDQLGEPTKRRREAASGVIFLEYHLPKERYQLLVSASRVIEVNRYR